MVSCSCRSSLASVSRDVLVQDLPEGIASVGDIPDHWLPRPLPFGHADVVRAVVEIAADADATNQQWISVDREAFTVEVNVADESPLTSFALHVRGTDRQAADVFISELLARLGARTLDTDSDTGLFRL